MLVSTKGRYALRVMAELAIRGNDGYIPLALIAREQEISEKYLEAIITLLSKAELLDGHRGKGGGYRLNREPAEYSVAEILRVVDGSLAPVSCLECEVNKCPRADRCLTLPMWRGLNSVISDYLSGYTLEDIIHPKMGKNELPSFLL